MSATANQAGSATQDESRIPYQLPIPAEALTEIVQSPSLPTDERLWGPQRPNVGLRHPCLNASQRHLLNLLRLRKSFGLIRHLQPAPVHALCLPASLNY